MPLPNVSPRRRIQFIGFTCTLLLGHTAGAASSGGSTAAPLRIIATATATCPSRHGAQDEGIEIRADSALDGSGRISIRCGGRTTVSTAPAAADKAAPFLSPSGLHKRPGG